VIGGQLISWNEALAQGFWQTFIQTIMIGAGYSCLVLSLAEMTSILPFAGGNYGFARCAMGPMTGYLVGLCESVEYVLYVASAGSAFAMLCKDLFSLENDQYDPAFFVLLYVICIPAQVYGGSAFWAMSGALGVLGLLFVLLYIFAAFPDVDIDHESPRYHDGFTTMSHFVSTINLPAWFFIGVEAMTLSCNR